MGTLEVRLRQPSPGLRALPWSTPLEEWDERRLPLRDLAVGPSRHVVRFVEADGALWALKALPRAVAVHEYDVLRALEERDLSAVRAAGVVQQPRADDAILLTRYLERSWQYRRLLMNIPSTLQVQRSRLFDAMAVLLVDLHRNGVYWGDCSLANTLFMRDGQTMIAWLVDAETAELHATLSDGQRRDDIEIMVENIAGGLLDVAASRGEPPSLTPLIMDEARGVAERYDQLWSVLHDEPIVGLEDHYEIDARLRRINELGFALDEVRFEATDPRGEQVRMSLTVAGRSFHSERLAELTGLHVSEGQATVLLNDLRSFHATMQQESGIEVPEEVAARHWLHDVLEPGRARAHEALGGVGDPVQAYCDLLEVRWLLSEEAGYDVGDGPALEALATRRTPTGSAADLVFVDAPTGALPAVQAAPPTDLDEPSGPPPPSAPTPATDDDEPSSSPPPSVGA